MSIFNLFLYPILLIPRLRFVPRLLAAYYRAINKETKFGLNIKAVAYIAITFAFIVAIPVHFLFVAIIGFFGALSPVDYDEIDIKKLESSLAFFRSLDEAFQHHLECVTNWQPEPLPPNTKPFDIKGVAGLRGLLGAAILITVGSPSLTILLSLQLPRVLWRILCNQDWYGEFFTSMGLFITCVVIGTLAIPIVLFGSIIVYLIIGFERGYSEGVWSAYDCLVDDSDRLSKKLWEMGCPVSS